MNILSLFDGMSCGQQAIYNLGITNYTYFASEIDKYAIQVTQVNFPNTIQIGDVKNIGMEENYFYSDGMECSINKFDLLLGGSPCQGFSFAGKGLNFDDERSKLFFEYVRILKEVKPKYFLLENVKMKKEYQYIISEHLFGVQPFEINSALLTAQNRVRLYWLGELQEDGTYKRVEIEQPQDKGVLFKNIREYNLDILSEEYITKVKNRNAQTKPFNKIILDDMKTPCLLAKGFNSESSSMIIVKENGGFRKLSRTEGERLQGVKDGYTNIVSEKQAAKMLGNGWTIPIIEHILKHIL